MIKENISSTFVSFANNTVNVLVLQNVCQAGSR